MGHFRQTRFVLKIQNKFEFMIDKAKLLTPSCFSRQNASKYANYGMLRSISKFELGQGQYKYEEKST